MVYRTADGVPDRHCSPLDPGPAGARRLAPTLDGLHPTSSRDGANPSTMSQLQEITGTALRRSRLRFNEWPRPPTIPVNTRNRANVANLLIVSSLHESTGNHCEAGRRHTVCVAAIPGLL